MKYIKNFIRKHIVAPFPYTDICLDCKKGTCIGCKHQKHNTV